MKLSLVTPALLLLVVACGGSSSSSSSEAPAPTPPATTDEVTAHPAFHFIGSAAQPVTEIVYTDAFTVHVDGLIPKTEVTLSAHMYTPGVKGRGYTSKATFTVDEQGAIDSSMPSLRGTWTGVDADAIFWSAAEGPLQEGLGPDRRDAFFDVSDADGVVFGGASLKRLAMTPNVKTEVVTSVPGLVAEMFFPAEGVTDRVPVVAFGGSEGGISGGESFAMRFASLGHPTLAVAYFGTEGVPSDLSEIPLEYFEKAFSYLDSRPETRKGKAVVIGGSRGGELALLLGATFPNRVSGVIAETPSAYRWAGLDPTNPKSAWTFGGKPLAYVPDSVKAQLKLTTVKTPKGDDAYVLRGTFEQSLADAEPDALEAARIRVEDIAGPVLMLGGSDDQMWPACDFVAGAMAKLAATGHSAKYKDEGSCFPSAGHSVGSVGLPTEGSMWAALGTTTYSLGGTAAANAHAGRQSDAKIQAFLANLAK